MNKIEALKKDLIQITEVSSKEIFGIKKYDTYRKFGQKVYEIRKNVRKNIKKMRKENRKIIGYGAPAKATTALNFFGISNEIEFIVMKVPNITDISFGRGVGYTFTEHDLGEEIHKISATKIRKEMRSKDELT